VQRGHYITKVRQELASTQANGQVDTQKHVVLEMQIEQDKTNSEHHGKRFRKSSVCCLHDFVK
jgi:hypothetical protein